jgi:tetratricopeptide (TPR) repeat protein
MCLSSLLLAGLPLSAAEPTAEKPPWQRLLQVDDARKAQMLESRLQELQQAGKFEEALAVAEELAALRTRVQGAGHWQAVNAQQVVEAVRKASRAGKEAQAKYAQSFADQREANALVAKGRYRQAQLLLEGILAIRSKVLGEEHPDTAASYAWVADNLNAQGRYQEAQESLQKALHISRKVLGEEHPHTALSYNNVAFNLNAQGRYKEAQEGFQKALDILRKVLGEEHPNTAQSYNNLAANLNAQGRHKEAQEGYQKALDINRKVLGEEHPYTALSYDNLAVNLGAQGEYVAAEEGLRKALAIRHKVLGEEHPDTATSSNNLAANLDAQGRYKEAEKMYVRGADAFLASRLQLAASGLGRAAKTSERSPLLPLAALLARNGKPALAWERLEQSLGRGAWDDLSARLRRPAKELARQTDLLRQLERFDQLLIQVSAIKESTEQQKKERDALLDRRREAQEQLTNLQHHLEETYGPVEGKVFDSNQIQAALPADAALLTWIDFSAGPKAAEPNGEHWAILLRSQGEPVFERLHGSGPGGDWTDQDYTLPQRLRTALQSPRGDWRELARKFAEQRLQPLARHLAAAEKRPAVRHLIVLPSLAMRGVPVEVLAEDVTVTYASSGTFFAHLKKQPAVTSTGLLALGDPVFDRATPTAKERPLPPGGVLLTLVQPGSNAATSGLRPDDVLLKYADTELKAPADLKAAIAAALKAEVPVQVWREGATFSRRVRPGPLGVVLANDPAPKALAERYRLDRVLVSRSGDDGWAQLPGTRVEVESLGHLFGDSPAPRLLFDSEASEQKLDALASRGELANYRYIHLATHGEVDDAWPLRSAVILSRDALPDPQKQLLAGKPIYDGRLTAEEMLRTWNLQSELVTLSACQSGLGKYERGEGFVGFAQALLLCGSRSVCLSLWKVDDAATALLMHRFYANLLGKREALKAPMPKAAALREAKDWLRNLSRAEVLKVAAQVSQGVERGKGRPKLELLPPVPEPTPAAKGDKPYAHPYYWAAFILIGDPS